MGLFQTAKPKSSGKVMITAGTGLMSIVVQTLNHIAQLVGATLGPGGRPVLIERPEMGMKPIVTKDGVTVIKHLGYASPVQQLILESARDASLRTASESGDGTTSAMILSAAIVKYSQDQIIQKTRISPQRIVREMNNLVPYVRSFVDKYRIEITGENYRDVLLKVATLSANGDVDLAKVVVDSMDLVGEEGNLTIIEASGSSRCEIERIAGYTIDVGAEESCKKFSQGFINDRSGTMTTLDRPVFLLYDGVINDTIQVLEALNKISEYMEKIKTPFNNVALVAHGFSDVVLGDLHVNWNHPQTINVFPLLTPQSAILNWRTHFLYDLQAYTGSPVFNPIDRPIVDLDPQRLYETNLVQKFECGRFRASVMSAEDTDLIDSRVDELKLQLQNPESQYEANDLNVRIGKLTSGIVKLTVYGPSQGETRERRDRAEDAWMSIRCTLKHGACPAGGYVLCRLSADLIAAAARVNGATKVALNILAQSLLDPVTLLYSNYGYSLDEIEAQLSEILIRENEVFDIAEQKWVDKFELLDSVSAVAQSIENSISIASLLGTLGGIVSFDRDVDADRDEAKSVADYNRTVSD